MVLTEGKVVRMLLNLLRLCVKQTMNVYNFIRAMEIIFSWGERWKCSIQRSGPELNGTFSSFTSWKYYYHCTVALINIHYLYTVSSFRRLITSTHPFISASLEWTSRHFTSYNFCPVHLQGRYKNIFIFITLSSGLLA